MSEETKLKLIAVVAFIVLMTVWAKFVTWAITEHAPQWALTGFLYFGLPAMGIASVIVVVRHRREMKRLNGTVPKPRRRP